ncbi:BZ3500_MvSof-1268-A1-R1_Chr2-1g04363 [Microbotryum saponariae]|uniref:BZ3500_MvSof-1268-A1-R1_Chr2-1g04363 protein n=1 Tax=Microbotryum saponariae TaxID=289078 RepID=A0A2X0MB67_9BASI|nr:BZ3500_MvSof-1268-A1-R1_Chr2-1g04363 [Microbotryum saponariae]SCZ91551.1 BZ3501_MvSof-1269-A2-R1_Chr2-1g04019 [Microbotryum saponariae]
MSSGSTPSSSTSRGTPRRPPKLPSSAFAPAPVVARRAYPQRILDTHVHLWTTEQLDQGNITWPPTCSNALNDGAHSLEGEYAPAVLKGVKMVGRHVEAVGCVYVQAEYKHDDAEKDGSGGGWESSLAEVKQLSCKRGLLCGVRADVKVLALCPWAPVHLGASVLESYLPKITSAASSSSIPIASFRYLLQDSPNGTYLSPDFISGLHHLGSKGYAFDHTVDSRRGEWMLQDSVEMISTLRSQGGTTKIILDHCGKPDLASWPRSSNSSGPDNVASKTSHGDWLESIYQLALFPDVYVKVSGLLDLCPAETVDLAAREFEQKQRDASSRQSVKGGQDAMDELKARIKKVVEPILEAFGIERVMIGSVLDPDWPMFRACTIPTREKDAQEGRDVVQEASVWALGVKLCLDVLLELGLDGPALDRIFEGTAREAYGISSA